MMVYLENRLSGKNSVLDLSEMGLKLEGALGC